MKYLSRPPLKLRATTSSYFELSTRAPGLRDRSGRSSEQHQNFLGPNSAAGQLFSLAYPVQRHLVWAIFNQLSAEGLATALESGGSSSADFISLCLDPSQSDPEYLAEILSRFESRRNRFLLKLKSNEGLLNHQPFFVFFSPR